MIAAPATRAALLCLLLATTITYADVTGTVVSVTDGDTIRVLDDNRVQHRVRLLCIDAPERGQPFGNASREHLAAMVAGKRITVESDSTDRYGRVLGMIGDVNLRMVRDGYAWDYDRYTCGAAYRDAERAAREKRVGLWAEPNPVPPWEWRQR